MSQKKSAGADVFRRAAIPSLLLFLAASSSILLSYERFFHSTICFAAGLAAALIFFFTLIYLLSQFRERFVIRVLRLFIYCFFSGLVFLISWSRAGALSNTADASLWKEEVSARIISLAESRYSIRLILECASIRYADCPHVTAVSFVPRSQKYNEGDELVIQSRLDKITSDDFLSDLRREGIHYRVTLNERNHLITGKIPAPLRSGIRNWIIATNNHLYGEKTGGVVNALYLGDSFFTDRKTMYDFTRAGLLHILAASGTHVALVAAIPLLIFSFLRINRKVSLACASLLIVGYLFITCAPVSLVRACVMFWFLSVFQIFGKEKNPLNALYLSGSVILIIYPYDLYTLGFQLSFGATLGLILFYQRFMAIIPKIPFKAKESLSLTFSAQILVLPIIALTLGQINFTGIISNLIIVPGISFAMVSSFVPLALFPLNGHIAEILAIPVRILYEMNLSATEFFARLDGHFILSCVPPILLVPWIIFCITPLIRFRIKTAGFILCITALASVFVPLKIQRTKTYQEIPLAVTGHSITFSGDHAIINGGLNNEDIPAAEEALDKQGYVIPEIILSDVHDESIRGTERFIRKRPVTRISISRNIVINGNLRSFIETVECDGIPLLFIGKEMHSAKNEKIVTATDIDDNG